MNKRIKGIGKIITIAAILTALTGMASVFDTALAAPQEVPGQVTGWGVLGASGRFEMWGAVKMEFTAPGVYIKATRINSVMTAAAATPKTGTITGMAKFNGAGPYPFTVKVVDAADPGAGADKFTIDVASPTPFHSSGTLTRGDITIVK